MNQILRIKQSTNTIPEHRKYLENIRSNTPHSMDQINRFKVKQKKQNGSTTLHVPNPPNIRTVQSNSDPIFVENANSNKPQTISNTDELYDFSLMIEEEVQSPVILEKLAMDAPKIKLALKLIMDICRLFIFLCFYFFIN